MEIGAKNGWRRKESSSSQSISLNDKLSNFTILIFCNQAPTMNFKGHATGATAAAILMTALTPFLHSNPDSKTILIVFALTWFMGLFPDLDTASIIQRWFYRAMLLALFVTLIRKERDTFVILSFLSVIPLIDKHRGWTHWRTTPWLLAIGFAILNEYLRAKGALFGQFNWERVLTFFETYFVYIIGAVVGHYTHLFLDSKTVRKAPWLAWLRKIDK